MWFQTFPVSPLAREILSADQQFFVGFSCKVLWGSGFARFLLWELYFSVMGFQRMLLPHHVFCVLFIENFLWCFYQVFSVLLRILCGVLFSVLLKFICGVYVVFVLLRILCHVSASCIFWVTEHSVAFLQHVSVLLRNLCSVLSHVCFCVSNSLMRSLNQNIRVLKRQRNCTAGILKSVCMCVCAKQNLTLRQFITKFCCTFLLYSNFSVVFQ